VISSFCHDVDEICALLGYQTTLDGNPLPTFQDNVSDSMLCNSPEEYISQQLKQTVASLTENLINIFIMSNHYAFPSPN
jgi:hypothetical protein